jgi:hypothetical protein
VHSGSDLIADFWSRAYARLLVDDGRWRSMARNKILLHLTRVSRTERKKRNESESRNRCLFLVTPLSFFFCSGAHFFFHSWENFNARYFADYSYPVILIHTYITCIFIHYMYTYSNIHLLFIHSYIHTYIHTYVRTCNWCIHANKYCTPYSIPSTRIETGVRCTVQESSVLDS